MRQPYNRTTSSSLSIFAAEASQQANNYTHQLVIDGALLTQDNAALLSTLKDIIKSINKKHDALRQAEKEKEAAKEALSSPSKKTYNKMKTKPKNRKSRSRNKEKSQYLQAVRTANKKHTKLQADQRKLSQQLACLLEQPSASNLKRLKSLPACTLAHILCATQAQHLLAKHLFDDQPNIAIHAAAKEFYQAGFIRPLEADDIYEDTDKEIIEFQAMAYQITALSKDTVTLTNVNNEEKMYTRIEFETRRRDIVLIDINGSSLHTPHHFVMPFEIMQQYINLMLQKKSHTPYSCPEFDGLKCGMLLFRQYQHPHSISKLPSDLESYKATATHLLKNIETIGIKTTSCPDYAALIQLTKLQHLPTVIISNRATPMAQLYEQLQKHLNAGQFEAHQAARQQLVRASKVCIDLNIQQLNSRTKDQLNTFFEAYQCVSIEELADRLTDEYPSPLMTQLQERLLILNDLATPLKALVCDTLPSRLFKKQTSTGQTITSVTHQPTLFQTTTAPKTSPTHLQPRTP